MRAFLTALRTSRGIECKGLRNQNLGIIFCEGVIIGQTIKHIYCHSRLQSLHCQYYLYYQHMTNNYDELSYRLDWRTASIFVYNNIIFV